MSETLSKAFHMPQKEKHIAPMGELNNVEIGWTMGAQIYHILHNN